MFIATAIVSAVLAAVLAVSAFGKLTGNREQMCTLSRVGFPADKVWILAGAEGACAIGLVVGIFWWPVGVTAAAGVILYFLGAVWAHVRKGDWEIALTVILVLVGVKALALRVVTT
jgi:hypothetical protein